MKKAIIAAVSVLAAYVCFAADDKTRISCVGDSITFGHGIKEAERKYPQQLGAILGEKFDVRNFGVSGTTLLSNGDHPYIKTSAYRNALAFNPNIVIIKLGTNDTKPQNWKHAGEFERDLNAMIDAFANLETKPKIYLCYPCPFYQLDGRHINEDRIFNGVIPILRKVARERGLPVIDMHTALSDRPQFFPDKLHPNGDGARAMAETAAKKILEDLKAAKAAK